MICRRCPTSLSTSELNNLRKRRKKEEKAGSQSITVTASQCHCDKYNLVSHTQHSTRYSLTTSTMADRPKKQSRVLAALTADPTWDAPSGSQVSLNNLRRKATMASPSPAESSARKQAKAGQFESEERSSDAEGELFGAFLFLVDASDAG